MITISRSQQWICQQFFNYPYLKKKKNCPNTNYRIINILSRSTTAGLHSVSQTTFDYKLNTLPGIVPLAALPDSGLTNGVGD